MKTLLCLSILYTIIQWIRIYIKYKNTNKDEYDQYHFLSTYYNSIEIVTLIITSVITISFIGLLIITYLP